MTIPYVLYKTGPFDTITQPEIVECFQINEEMLKSKIVYFNDRACENFIKQHFGPNIIKAYDMLIPGAYKADLWRLCVLYIHGGIYGDLTQTFLREYNVNKDNADVIFVRDRPFPDNYGIYNAFIAAKKRNGFIKYCIEQIVKQILMRNKGKNALDITGPQALGRHYLTFFHINRINFGLQTLQGIDNKIYRINVPFCYTETGMCKKHSSECCLELNHTCIFLRKTKNHFKLLYNVKNTHYDKSIHYGVLYDQNKIFKPR